jgi:alanyl aminopeptidase
VGVIREVSDLTLSGELPVGDALALVPEFAGDSSRPVVESLIEMTTATNRMVPAELTENFARFIRKSFGERARQLGWLPKAGEDDEQLLLRQKLLPLVAIYGREEGLSKEARSLAERWLTDPKAVPPPMVNPVLTAAAAGGDRALFDRYVTALRNTKDPQVRHRLYGAVGSFRDREIAKAGLRLFLDKEFDPRESFGLLSGPVGDPRTSDLPFEFVKDNWAALREKLPRSVDTDMAAFLPFTARGMCSEEGRAEAERFFTDKMKNATGGPRNLAQTLESMRICAAARKANGPGIAEFLRQY